MEIKAEKNISFNGSPAKLYKMDSINSKNGAKKVIDTFSKAGIEISQIEVGENADMYERQYEAKFETPEDFFIPDGQSIDYCTIRGNYEGEPMTGKISIYDDTITLITTDTDDGIRILESISEKFSTNIAEEKKTVDKAQKL